MIWKLAWKLPADAEDFPGDSPERQSAALAVAGALCNPEDVISDWGDFDGDHSDEVHDRSEGVIGHTEGFAKNLDVNIFYDQCRAERITIRDQNSDENDH